MKTTVRRAVLIAVLLGTLLPALGVGLYLARIEYARKLESDVQTILQHEANVVALGVRESLWALDSESASALVEAVMQDSALVSIEVLDPSLGRFVYHDFPERRTGTIHELERAVMHRGEAIGRVHVVLSDGTLREALLEQLIRFSGLLALQLLVSVVLILFVLQRRIGRPLQKLGAEAVTLARGDLDKPIVPLRDDEIGNVEAQLEVTRQALQQLVRTLEQKNDVLEIDLQERMRVEAALRDREQRLSALVDQSPLAVIEFDLGWHILEWNAAAMHMFGWPQGKIVGHHASILHGQNMQDRDLALLGETGHDGIHHALTVKQECVRADGRSITCHWYYSLIRDAAGAPQRIVAIVEDITTRQRSDDEIRRLATVVRLTSNLIALTDDSGTIEWANKAFLSRFDSITTPVLQRKLADVLQLADIDRTPNPLITTTIAEGSQLSGVEAPCLGASDKPLWAAIELQAIRDDDDKIIQWAALLTDVTERRHTADALRHSELKFFSIFQHSPIPICVVRRHDGICVDINPGFVGNFGFTRESLVGHPFASSPIHADVANQVALRDLMSAGEAVSGVEIRLRNASGAIRDCQIHIRPVTMDEAPCLLIAAVDVTSLFEARREIEELNQSLEKRVAARTRDLAASNAELETTLDRLRRTLDELVRAEKLAALGSLVAGIAHELNTPIGNSLMVASTLHDVNQQFQEQIRNGLRRSALESYVSETESAADILMRNLQRAAELISSFKQVAVDQTSSQRRQFDLAEVVNEIVVTMQPVLRKSHHRILIEIPPGLQMNSYPGPLGQVIANLLNNTLLHAFDGREQGTVRLSAEADGETGLRLCCADDGVGISPANLKRVFDPFFTTRLGREGTGLGLNIVHNIVTGMLGGEISVESTLGEGSRFTLRLPRQAPRNQTEQSGAATES